MKIISDRLLIEPLSSTDIRFILELLNTEGWLRFIGNRNINSESDAADYIARVHENPDITYWTVKRKEDDHAIGLVTLIKRDYLDFHDIGFAFLPSHFGNNYAYEATKAVLLNLLQHHAMESVVAITYPENFPSISLLEKLGFKFQNTFHRDEEVLNLYHSSLMQYEDQ